MKVNVKPIIIKDKETNEEYTLQFNAETVKYAESKGFNIENLDDKKLTLFTDLFYYSFLMHHKGIAKSTTDGVLEKMGGFPNGFMQRLCELYLAPYMMLVQDEESRKNALVTVEM